MSAFFEGRTSDSPYIDMIWRGHVEQDYHPVCPADVRWNLLFTRYGANVRVTAEGATTQFVPKIQYEGVEFLVIKFRLGVFMPFLRPDNILNGDEALEGASSQSFWIRGTAWQFPDFNNVETFVHRLVQDETLVYDPVVTTALQSEPTYVSSRTVRRRFLQSTGLTPKVIEQIERAQKAQALLVSGVSILDTVYLAGYADQPHLTRSLRRFIGQTPAQIAAIRFHSPNNISICEGRILIRRRWNRDFRRCRINTIPAC